MYSLATSRFMGSQNLEGTGYFLRSTHPAAGSNGNSFGFTAGLPNDLWNIQMASRQVDATFDPAIGFVTRRGYRRYQPSVEYGPRPRSGRLVRRDLFSAGLDVQTDLDNQLLQRSVELKLFEVQFQSQDSFSATLSNNREVLDEAFTPSGGLTLPLGAEYDTNALGLRASTANRTREQLPVRLGERRARLAVALPLDSATRQRHLLRLHPQLGGRPGAEPLQHARPPRGVEGALHPSFLGFTCRRPMTCTSRKNIVGTTPNAARGERSAHLKVRGCDTQST